MKEHQQSFLKENMTNTNTNFQGIRNTAKVETESLYYYNIYHFFAGSELLFKTI